MSRKLLALIVWLGATLVAAPAWAADYIGPRAQWMTWQEAISKVPGPSGEIRLRAGYCPDTGALGCADIGGGDLWLATNRVFVAAHERGHFFDARNLNAFEREQLQHLMGLPVDEAWEKQRSYNDDCGVDECPSEMFADAYANCALGRSPAGKRRRNGHLVGGWESPFGYSPTPMVHRAVCDAIRAYA